LDSATRESIEKKVLEEFATAVENRAVADRGSKGGSGEDRESVIDRLASRLFNDEFWISEAPTADIAKE
jgi:hypothetical protein